VFTGAPKKDAVVVSMSDVRERFRLTMNVVDIVEPDGSLKELPCARALWVPRPNLKTSAECWLRSGASHHTCMTTSVGREAWEDFARIAGVELATIDENTTAREFERDLEISEMYHRLNNRH
ncbi:MAG: L-arabinose isomerase, partial [Bifidobacterium dentium]